MTRRMFDLYAVLGVESDADATTIRAAYRRLARRHHPDTGGDERIMMVLNKAWAILRDPERRDAYDRQRGWPAKTVSTTNTSADAQPPAPVGRASGTVLDFGRYAGWSFGQLAVYDPDYLLWLERTPIGRPMGAEIRDTLARHRVEPAPVHRPQARRGLFAGLRG
jgi:curved DNA-binding protein CbpA